MVEVDAVEDLVEFAKIGRSGGTVPQLTKTGMNVLAATFSKQARWTKAEKVQVQVVEMIRRVLGEESRDIRSRSM